MFALNFYAEYYEEVLKNGRKTLTIRMGDKSDKYTAGMIVWITVGARFARRQKLFTARRFVKKLLVQCGSKNSGSDRVHVYSMFGPLNCQRFRERCHRRFTRGIGRYFE